jgi:hypothetical protein
MLEAYHHTNSGGCTRCRKDIADTYNYALCQIIPLVGQSPPVSIIPQLLLTHILLPTLNDLRN